MLMFLGYWLPMIILIGSLIIFKKLFVKCIKTSDYSRNVIQEPITFPIWKYVLYFICAIVPVLNWITLIALLVTLCEDNYFTYYSWTGRNYWYEIPDVTWETIIDKFCNCIDSLINKKWFICISSPFVYLYKIMIKQV